MSSKKSPVLRVGLTGGIASGKTLVADLFAQLGAVIIDTDVIARDVVRRGEPALTDIIKAFGPDFIDRQGELDRGKLRAEVFSDDARRRQLEAILHPRIRERTLALAAAAAGPYIVIVVPLLVESGFDRLVDRVLVVDCPQDLQRRRLKARDDESDAQIERILAAQAGRHTRLAIADDVIDNAGSPRQTRAQVEALHEKYTVLAASRA